MQAALALGQDLGKLQVNNAVCRWSDGQQVDKVMHIIVFFVKGEKKRR